MRQVGSSQTEETIKRPTSSTRTQGSIYVTPRDPMGESRTSLLIHGYRLTPNCGVDMRLSEENVLSRIGYVVVKKGPDGTVRLRDKPRFLLDDVCMIGRDDLVSLLDLSARMKKRKDLEGIEVRGWIKVRPVVYHL